MGIDIVLMTISLLYGNNLSWISMGCLSFPVLVANESLYPGISY